jgi:hypothetical protein
MRLPELLGEGLTRLMRGVAWALVGLLVLVFVISLVADQIG